MNMDWWTNLEPKDQVTLGIAVGALLIGLYGAVLSTINLVSQRRLHHADIGLQWNEPMLIWQGTGSVQNWTLRITVTNHGHVTVHLDQIMLQLSGSSDVYFQTELQKSRLPFALESHKCKDFYLTRAYIVKRFREDGKTGRVRMRAVVKDETGRIKGGRWQTFDLDKRIVLTRRGGEREEFPGEQTIDGPELPNHRSPHQTSDI